MFLNPPWGKFEAKCKPDCSKKVCQRRGFHLQADFPGIGAWAEKLVAECRAGGLVELDGVPMRNNAVACSVFVVEPLKRNPKGRGPRPEFWSVAELREEGGR